MAFQLSERRMRPLSAITRKEIHFAPSTRKDNESHCIYSTLFFNTMQKIGLASRQYILYIYLIFSNRSDRDRPSPVLTNYLPSRSPIIPGTAFCRAEQKAES